MKNKEVEKDIKAVNHPDHYCSHPSGIECIEVTRHYCFSIGNAIKYLWRAGLKKEEGMSDKEKEIEDLKKAIWYINDRITQLTTQKVIFPELRESEGKKIKKRILLSLEKDLMAAKNSGCNTKDLEECITWLEKQGKQIVDCPQNHQDINHPNGCIVMEDFNGGEGFYKLNLDYLNKKQVEEIEEIVKTWNTKSNDDIIKECVGMALTDVPQSRFESYGTSLKECLAWLEKQGEQKPSDKDTIDIDKMVEKWKQNTRFYSTSDILAYRQGLNDAIGKVVLKHAWSEEDERMSNAAIRACKYIVENFENSTNDCEDAIDWLKSLKERVQPQPKQEWTDEDEKRLKSCLNILQAKGLMGVTETINTKWLKSLKERIKGE